MSQSRCDEKTPITKLACATFLVCENGTHLENCARTWVVALRMAPSTEAAARLRSPSSQKDLRASRQSFSRKVSAFQGTKVSEYGMMVRGQSLLWHHSASHVSSFRSSLDSVGLGDAKRRSSSFTVTLKKTHPRLEFAQKYILFRRHYSTIVECRCSALAPRNW